MKKSTFCGREDAKLKKKLRKKNRKKQKKSKIIFQKISFTLFMMISHAFLCAHAKMACSPLF